MSDLAAYFARIGYDGPTALDSATLRAVHRAHSLAIPYENLDVQLERPLTTDPAAAFDKIVRRGRGGWCYEMNGLLGWALSEMGFSVTRMAGGVMREAMGDVQVGNHLVLRVDFPEGPWIADVGFGDGPIEAYPMRPGPIVQNGFGYTLAEIEDGWWRLSNREQGAAKSFDFRPVETEEALLAERCQNLQSSDTSPFVMLLICMRHTEEGLMMLRGRVLRTVTPGGGTDHLIQTEAEFAEVLKDRFGLVEPEVARLWRKVCDQHAKSFAATVS